MAIRLRTEGVWARITSLVSSQKPNLVAVPFVAQGATDRLPLKRGDVLVLRFDDQAIKSGLNETAKR